MPALEILAAAELSHKQVVETASFSQRKVSHMQEQDLAIKLSVPARDMQLSRPRKMILCGSYSVFACCGVTNGSIIKESQCNRCCATLAASGACLEKLIKLHKLHDM